MELDISRQDYYLRNLNSTNGKCFEIIRDIITALPESLFKLIGKTETKLLRAFINNSKPSEIGWYKDGVDGYGTYVKEGINYSFDKHFLVISYVIRTSDCVGGTLQIVKHHSGERENTKLHELRRVEKCFEIIRDIITALPESLYK